MFKREWELKLSCHYWAQIACVMIRGEFDEETTEILGRRESLTLISNREVVVLNTQ